MDGDSQSDVYVAVVVPHGLRPVWEDVKKSILKFAASSALKKSL